VFDLNTLFYNKNIDSHHFTAINILSHFEQRTWTQNDVSWYLLPGDKIMFALNFELEAKPEPITRTISW